MRPCAWLLCALLLAAVPYAATAQTTAGRSFRVDGRTVTLVPAYELQSRYVEAARAAAKPDLAALYAQQVSNPVLEQCAAGGEYSDLAKYNVSSPVTNLDALAGEITALRSARLAERIEKSVRAAAKLLPSPDLTICIMAADPALDYVKTDLHGVQGLTVGAGKILLQISPQGGWQDWLAYTLVHEYHHSAWTARHYAKNQPQDLLAYLLFEGRADAFAHLVYPRFDIPWDHALTAAQEAEVWAAMQPQLASQDFRVKRSFMFGGRGDVPRFAGYAIGFHIVESYLRRHPEAKVGEWTSLDPQTLLAQSGFAPGQ